MYITVAVSSRGSASTTTGIRIGKSELDACEMYRSSSVSEPMTKPMNRLPQSPRNTVAGWKL